MSKMMTRTAFVALLLVALTALPAFSQKIPAGKDPWVTPNNGMTFTTFADGDVEALCGKDADSSWNHKVTLTGVPGSGVDYDTVVARLDPVELTTTSNPGVTRVQVVALAFRSVTPTDTPCGKLDWRVGLIDTQPVTQMKITRTTTKGGFFEADLVVNVAMQAYYAGTSTYLGTVYYSITLPQGTSPTPWSFDPVTRAYRPGITETENCIAALRKKLTQYAVDSEHYYFISNMIAQGRCYKG